MDYNFYNLNIKPYIKELNITDLNSILILEYLSYHFLKKILMTFIVYCSMS